MFMYMTKENLSLSVRPGIRDGEKKVARWTMSIKKKSCRRKMEKKIKKWIIAKHCNKIKNYLKLEKYIPKSKDENIIDQK